MKLLHLDSSALGANSISRELSAAAVAQQRLLHPQLQVTYRDLDLEPLPHLTAQSLAQADPAEAAAAELAMQQFLDADVIVIGAPMYNFAIPSTLKAWIDRIAVAGRTFRYTATGPEGLAGGKRIIIASARGGIYADPTPAASASLSPARAAASMPTRPTIFRSRICASCSAFWASTTSPSSAPKAWRIRQSIAVMRLRRRWPSCSNRQKPWPEHAGFVRLGLGIGNSRFPINHRVRCDTSSSTARHAECHPAIAQ